MAYNTMIPLSTDKLKVSQSDILNNFIAISDLFVANHQNFNEFREGTHKYLQFPEQGAAPVTGASEIALYSAVGATSGVTEMVFKRANNPASVIPFTEGDLNQQGWTRLPTGLIIKWNTVTVSAIDAASNAILNVPLNGPALSSLFWGIVIPQADPGNLDGDVNAAAYVTSLASGQVNYKIWLRDIDNNPGTPLGPLNMYAMLLGVE